MPNKRRHPLDRWEQEMIEMPEEIDREIAAIWAGCCVFVLLCWGLLVWWMVE